MPQSWKALGPWARCWTAALLVGALTAGPAGAATQYRYDSQGRLVSVVYDDGKRITYNYDEAGNRETVVTAATPGNLPPVALDDAITVDEGSGATVIPVLSNDTDPNSDARTIATAMNGAKGTVTFTSTSLTYTLSAGSDGPGTDAFVYSVKDPAGAYDTGVVAIKIDNVAPNAVNDDFTVSNSAGYRVLNVTANDTDPGLDPFSVTNVTQPLHGQAFGSGALVLYLPQYGYVGSDSFQYTITDSDGGSDTAAVSLTVEAVNVAPVADDEVIQVARNGSRTIDPREGDTDGNGDNLTISAVSQGANGAVSNNAGVSVTYTPSANYTGPDSFTYTVSDGHGGMDVGTVTATVVLNAPPDAVIDTYTVVRNSVATLPVTSNDTDPDGHARTLVSVTSPSHGTASVSGNAVVYTPTTNYTGPDSFGYTIRDPLEATDGATVSITVSASNSPPVAGDDTLLVEGYVGQVLTASVNAVANDTDPNGQALTITSRTHGTKGTVTIVGNALSYTTNNTTVIGSDSFTYTISDGAGGTDEGTVNVTIARENPN